MQMDLPEIKILSPGAARAFKAIDVAIVGLAVFCLALFFMHAIRDAYIEATVALIVGLVLGWARDQLRDHVITQSQPWVEVRRQDREDGFACGSEDARRDRLAQSFSRFSPDQSTAVAAMADFDNEQSVGELAENGL